MQGTLAERTELLRAIRDSVIYLLVNDRNVQMRAYKRTQMEPCAPSFAGVAAGVSCCRFSQEIVYGD